MTDYMERKAERVITAWWESNDSRPLLIRGARRTGKTTLIKHVGSSLSANDMVVLDFQTDLRVIEQIFDVPSNDVDHIVRRIQEYTGKPCNPQSTLLIFDEIQLSEKALNSLRFFSGSRWRVVATGSLLGITLKQRRLPFPSGVRQIQIHPMDFEEFLWALGERPLAQSIREHAAQPRPFLLHNRTLDFYHRYLVVGGMPKVVDVYRSEHQFAAVTEQQREIEETYISDMTDPGNGISGISARRIWESLPRQLLRSSTKKFKYADVVRGGRRERLLEPLEWLEAAGLVSRNEMTHDTVAPLTAAGDEDGSFFKIYMADTGLMFAKFGIGAETFLDPNVKPLLSSDFRGAMAENYAKQALTASGISSFYWMPPGKTGGELDFVYQNTAAEVIPIEVKSARSVSSKTLTRFMQTGLKPEAIRLSERDFGISEIPGTAARLRSLPLYAAFTVGT